MTVHDDQCSQWTTPFQVLLLLSTRVKRWESSTFQGSCASRYKGQWQIINITDTMGCNYLSLPLILASGTTLVIYYCTIVEFVGKLYQIPLETPKLYCRSCWVTIRHQWSPALWRHVALVGHNELAQRYYYRRPISAYVIASVLIVTFMLVSQLSSDWDKCLWYEQKRVPGNTRRNANVNFYV